MESKNNIKKEGGMRAYGVRYKYKGEELIEKFSSKIMLKGFIHALRKFEDYEFLSVFGVDVSDRVHELKGY